MATLDTEATTPTASLKRAVDLLERLELPDGVGVNMQGACGTAPASVDLHPYTHADHEAVYRRLVLHDWEREAGWQWSKVTVSGVDVALHDVRGAAA